MAAQRTDVWFTLNQTATHCLTVTDYAVAALINAAANAMIMMSVINSYRRSCWGCSRCTKCCAWWSSWSSVHSAANIRGFCKKCSWSWWHSDAAFITQTWLRWTHVLVAFFRRVQRLYCVTLLQFVNLAFVEDLKIIICDDLYGRVNERYWLCKHFVFDVVCHTTCVLLITNLFLWHNKVHPELHEPFVQSWSRTQPA